MRALLDAAFRLLCGCLGLGRRRVSSRNKAPRTPAGNPLPATIHKVLGPQDLGPGRVIIVGDVHGCLDTLLHLLSKVHYQQGLDSLLFVGDLVGKGPQSQQVVATVRAWCEGSFCWVVRGNWDDAALAAGQYLQQGGSLQQLPHKFQSFAHELLPEDVRFLTELPFSIGLQGYNVVVVHAALIPGVPLQQQDLFVLTKVRDLVQAPDGRFIGLEQPDADLHSVAWAGCWQGPGHCFFGHDAKRDLQEAPAATGLDTGCVYGRRLTACVLPPLDRQAGTLPPTPSLSALRGELHSVASTFAFDKKAAKQLRRAL